MKNKASINSLLTLLLLVMLFHILVMLKIIPYNIAWGGRLQNDSDMYVFESISVLINLFLILVLLMKANYIAMQFRPKTINRILWFFLILFALNTLANLFAKTNFEKSFAGLTFVSAVLIWIILRPGRPDNLPENKR